ncbi:MAG: type II toxin-antitoxin system RelE/ParE family toxin [Polyangiales bacterium]
MKLPFEVYAADELEAAVTWYERERTGHGDLFASAVRRTVDRAARFPQSGVRAHGFDRERDVRRFSVLHFPYSVVTAIVNGRRAVVAVAHASREPGYWYDRVK